MVLSENESVTKDESEAVNLELYRTAFARLNFQDEYLFKFSAVFLTAHGALAVLAGTAVFGAGSTAYPALVIVSVIGLLLAVVWWFWIRHNDYWHSVWTGTLRDIEQHLKTTARVFGQNHGKIAKRGDRSGRFLPPGHCIAQLVPVIFIVAWAATLCVALSTYK